MPPSFYTLMRRLILCGQLVCAPLAHTAAAGDADPVRALPDPYSDYAMRVASLNMPRWELPPVPQAAMVSPNFARERLAQSAASYRQSALYEVCSEMSQAALLEPLCGFYYQLLHGFHDRNGNLLALEGEILSWHRQAPELEISRLDVIDVLALDLSRVSVFVVRDSRLRDIGVSAELLSAALPLDRLRNQLKDVLSHEQGAELLPETMALAVWGDTVDGGGQAQPLAVLVRAPAPDYPLAGR